MVFTVMLYSPSLIQKLTPFSPIKRKEKNVYSTDYYCCYFIIAATFVVVIVTVVVVFYFFKAPNTKG